MENTIYIREAEIRDTRQIKTILFNALKEYEIAIPDDYEVSDIDSIDEKNRIVKVCVLVRHDTVIGFVVLKRISENAIELKRLYLTPAERGRKRGEYLLKYAINFARENNYSTIRLETTNKFKAAVSLYKKHGFIESQHVEKAPAHDLALEKRLTF